VVSPAVGGGRGRGPAKRGCYTDTQLPKAGNGPSNALRGLGLRRGVRRGLGGRAVVLAALALCCVGAPGGGSLPVVAAERLSLGGAWPAAPASPLRQDLRGAAEVAGTDGDGLRVRRTADPEAETLVILDEGAGVEVLDGPVRVGGFAWYRVRYAGGENGWVAGLYLRAAAERVSISAVAAGSDAAVPAFAGGEGGRLAATGRIAEGSGAAEAVPADQAPARVRDPQLSGDPPAPGALVIPPSIAPLTSLPLRPLPPADTSDARFGLVEAFRLADTGLDVALGARYQRLAFWWRGLQPGPDAPLNPYYLPLELLDHELEQGYQVVGVILNTPDWAGDPAHGPRSVPTNLYLDWDDPQNYWARFAERLARDYAGRIDDWIVWNEPDIQPGDPNAAYFTWAGSLDDYYQLLRVGYRALKAGNPSARVHLAGLTYWADRRADRPQYFERLLDRILADPAAAQHNYYFDRVTLHLYTDPRGLYYVPRLYRELMLERGIVKPIWINETNLIPWDDPTNRGTGFDLASGMRCTLADQAAYLLQAFGLGLAGGAERISVYKAEDGYGAAYNPLADAVERAALVREDGTLRPAFLAYQTAVRYLSGAERAQYFTTPTVEAVVIERGNGRRTTVLWNAAPYPVVARVARAGTAPMLVDSLGRVLPLASEATEDTIALPPATCNTDRDDPARYLMGGETYLLVESGVPADRPAEAPRAEGVPASALRSAAP
jgi:Bacterial SH3 domain